LGSFDIALTYLIIFAVFYSVGYFNYRYFVNFLLFTMLGMIYGAFLLLEPFLLSKSSSYHQQAVLEHQYHLRKRVVTAATAGHELLTRIRPMVPFRSEKLYITLSFMLCVAVGIALVGLGGFHMYLISTGQTTIEFHARWSKGRRKGSSPYSRGTRLANWQQVYGTSSARWLGDSQIANWFNVLFCLCRPRYELPQYLPVPIPGQCTRRKTVESMAETPPGPVIEAV
jgi:DHHC palmitoyltransferase